MIMEAFPVDEHQSNGVVHHAVQTVGGIIRNHELALGRPFSKELGGDYVVIPCLIMRAAVMVSWSEICSDGRQPYERSRGTPYRKELPTS